MRCIVSVLDIDCCTFYSLITIQWREKKDKHFSQRSFAFSGCIENMVFWTSERQNVIISWKCEIRIANVWSMTSDKSQTKANIFTVSISAAINSFVPKRIFMEIHFFTRHFYGRRAIKIDNAEKFAMKSNDNEGQMWKWCIQSNDEAWQHFSWIDRSMNAIAKQLSCVCLLNQMFIAGCVNGNWQITRSVAKRQQNDAAIAIAFIMMDHNFLAFMLFWQDATENTCRRAKATEYQYNQEIMEQKRKHISFWHGNYLFAEGFYQTISSRTPFI